MCLGGTLSPELGKLSNMKSIILRNNYFNGTIPREIGDLKELEVLDLGYNNFTGTFPSDLVNNLSLSILLLDNNKFLDTLSPEVNNLKTLSELQVDENQLTSSHNDGSCNDRSRSWNIIQTRDATERKLLQLLASFSLKEIKSLRLSPGLQVSNGSNGLKLSPGVPSLQRLELVTACEDFSNIIGTMLDGTVYKGTLSSGVEIAVTSTAITSTKDWNKKLESQFRNKIETLSKVNHKNFVNLIGYCEEQKPFTRMMVFEYAPNGTLFEHLHITFDQFDQLKGQHCSIY
ncbi:hypothetical protein M8C21_013552 [Ambrosia artemisiifolia]|uniref:Protein kinase domain-containing protein n=1 Tax=Ambrosia artemisiifolia TaxID=4212 RepID=A0AAD5CPU2_AMBAR|nr:hypothetical protein M8C21_013552 [Ambrosia artemisiifolia]